MRRSRGRPFGRTCRQIQNPHCRCHHPRSACWPQSTRNDLGLVAPSQKTYSAPYGTPGLCSLSLHGNLYRIVLLCTNTGVNSIPIYNHTPQSTLWSTCEVPSFCKESCFRDPAMLDRVTSYSLIHKKCSFLHCHQLFGLTACQVASQACVWMSLWAPDPSVPRVISAERFLMPWIYSQGVWLGSALPLTTINVKSSEWEEWEDTWLLSFSFCLFHSVLVFFLNLTLKCFHWRLICTIDWLISFSALLFYFFHTEFSIQSITFPFFPYALSLFVRNVNCQSQMFMNQSNPNLNTAFSLWTLAQIASPLAPWSEEAWQMIAQYLGLISRDIMQHS